ncbi:MAG TPA: hypothetical protein PK280_07510 [Planctomycetota bacterium]|nr:hypothetical protein [Planctomycetota bacterium]
MSRSLTYTLRLPIMGLILTSAAALAGEAPAPAPAADPALREVVAQVQAVTPLPCITPREARDEHIRLTLTGGKGTLPLPVKGGTLNVLQAQGAVAVEVPGEGAGRAPASALLPREGFSAPLVVNLEYADKSTGIAALAFARGGRDGELFVRNLAVAATSVGGEGVFVIDDNCNGRYGEANEDAFFSAGQGGGGRLAVPLGPTVMLGGTPCSLQLTENGRKLTFKAAPAKLGAAGLNTGDGWGRLAGALLKGPAGSFALRSDRQVGLPVGSYELAYAVVEDSGGRRVLISGGDLKLEVVEGRSAQLPSLGPVKFTVQAGFDAATGRIMVEAPKAESVTCTGGRVTYLFPLPAPDIEIVRLPTNRDKDTIESVIRSFKMPIKGGNLTFHFGEANMAYYQKYRVDMIWKVGLGPEPRGSAAPLEVVPPPPKKK